MTFNSISFILFFTAVFILNYIVPSRFKWLFLLVCSYVFYVIMDFRSIWVLLGSSIADYYLAILIFKAKTVKCKRYFVAGSLIANISLILIYKYFNLFTDTAFSFAAFLEFQYQIPRLNLIIPVGLSFFSFKKMSYIVDVYRCKIEPERHMGHYLLYVSHFLEILSGPIDRASRLIPQIQKPLGITQNIFTHGLLLVLWGFFIKLVVADRLAIYVDAIFDNIAHHSGPSLLLAAYFYSFEIYCDFAGYTYMALGFGKMLGFNFSINFNFPYFSSSINEFWRRWHMTLSYWFRDYLYISLGGNRVSSTRKYCNLMIVFLLCGLWHGANWTFVAWGGLHGIYVVFGLVLATFWTRLGIRLRIPECARNTLRVVLTFHLVTLAWVFFRASSVKDAFLFLRRLGFGWPNLFIDPKTIAYGIGGVMILCILDCLAYRGIVSVEKFLRWPAIVRWGCFYALLFSIILAGVTSDSTFIYFQF